MAFCLGFQGCVKIDMRKPICIHRIAAGIFFALGGYICVSFGQLDWQATKRRIARCVRRAAHVAMLAALLGGIIIGGDAVLTFSTVPQIQDLPPEVITRFAICQYLYVGGLLISMATLC